jgi:hypothetical protein
MTVAYAHRYPGGTCLPLFNRFSYGRFYRTMLKTCQRNGIPYVVDIDDLFWQLPGYSSDTAQVDPVYRAFLEEMCAGAAVVVASTPFLQQQLQERFPRVQVALVENCSPGWFAPHGSALIANTDAVKLGAHDVSWFATLLGWLWGEGIGIQLLGDNAALGSGPAGMKMHSLPRASYFEYHQRLHWQGFRVGLIPVEASPYAQAKSAIKILEFVNHNIPVIASDSEPHRQLLARHPKLPVTLVENTEAAWGEALRSVVRAVPASELQSGVIRNQCLYETRERQLAQWSEVYQMLPRDPDIVRKNRAIERLFQAQAAYERVKRLRRYLPL